MRTLVLASLFATLAACSAVGGSQFTAGTGGSSTSGGAGAGSSTSGTGGGLGIGGSLGMGGNAGGGSPGCAAATQLVYVMTNTGAIWSFDPPSKKFTFVANLDCPSSGSPNSMAIDRNLVAWVNYYDIGGGALFTFNLAAKSGCKQAVQLGNGFGQVGMGFSTDTADGSDETLFIAGIGAGTLARIDMATKQVVPIGGFNGDPNLAGQSAELTGTGDARLYGYFTTFPEVRVAEIDKASAKILSDKPLSNFAPPSSWAFSFWGGDFYLYTSDGFNNSKVVHYSPANNGVDLGYVPDTGMVIVGAGVSTCAPIKPPA